MCSLVLLLFLIGGYNTVLAMREHRDEIAKLTAELEGSKMTVSALKEQQAKKTENTAAEALKGADAKNTDGGWKDGTYEGEGQGFGGKVVVEVTIRNSSSTRLHIFIQNFFIRIFLTFYSLCCTIFALSSACLQASKRALDEQVAPDTTSISSRLFFARTCATTPCAFLVPSAALFI